MSLRRPPAIDCMYDSVKRTPWDSSQRCDAQLKEDFRVNHRTRADNWRKFKKIPIEQGEVFQAKSGLDSRRIEESQGRTAVTGKGGIN